MENVLMKDVDLEEPTSFFDQRIFGMCSRDNATISNDTVDKIHGTMFDSQDFCWRSRRNYHTEASGKLWCRSQNLHGPTTWKVMQRNVWKDIASLQTKTSQQLLNKVVNAMHGWPSSQRWGNMSQQLNCLQYMLSQIVPKCLVFGSYWETWHIDGLWINLLDAVHEMDKSMWQNAWIVLFLTFITQVNTDNTVMWETQHSNVNLGLFQDSDFARRLWRLEVNIRRNLMHFWKSHARDRSSWMCKKQTSVSHSSTEAEIISLDAGLRMDGIPSLGLFRTLVIEIFHSATKTKIVTTQRDSVNTGRPVASRHDQAHEHEESNQSFNASTTTSWIVPY